MRKFTLVLFALMLFGSTLQAGHLSNRMFFSARMTGAQEVPSVSTDANGVAVFSLNETYDSLCVNIATAGLSGPITGLHIHEGAAGTNGGVVVPLTNFVIGNRVNIKLPLTDLDLDKMMSEMYYVNVHTTDNAAGEIRGQIKLESDWSHWAWLDESFSNTGATGYGIAMFNLSQDKRKLDVAVVTYGLTGPIGAAHLHSVATGGVVIGLDSLIVNGDQLMGTVDYSGFSPDTLMGGYYLNLHTAANTGGEIAGVPMLMKNRYAFDARLDNAFHGTNSDAMGLAHVELNASMDTIWYNVVWDTLDGNYSAMHFHAGSGGVLHDMGPGVSGNACQGMWVNPPDSAIAQLFTGAIYINLHTDVNAGGEIAGNVYRFAREGYMINIDASQTDPLVTSSATGGGVVTIDRDQSNAHYMIAADNFSGPVTAAHFHQGAMGTSGGVEYTLPWMNGGAYGYWSDSSTTPFMTSNSVMFRDGLIYVNLHTTLNPSGEARGQVLRGTPCFVDLSSSIGDPLANVTSLLVYPNPVNNQVTMEVEMKERSSGVLQIVDLRGQVLQQNEVQLSTGNNVLSLNTQNLSTGMYFLFYKDASNGMQISSRITKQ